MMIRNIGISVCIGLTITSYSYAQPTKDTYFQSKNYQVHLDTSKCLDTDIKCDVIYHGINLHNHNEVSIKGSTLNIGPSLDFRGYIFYRGKYTYTLMPDDNPNSDLWILEVNIRKSDGDHTILHESGKWIEPK